jgi:hypothetical protein
MSRDEWNSQSVPNAIYCPPYSQLKTDKVLEQAVAFVEEIAD